MNEYQKKIEDKILFKALEQYSINVVRTEFACEETNVFFKVYDDANNVYGMKICQEESNKLEDNESEVYFLGELAKRTDVLIPKVIYNNHNQGVTLVKDNVFSTAKRCILYNWIEGNDFDKNESIDNFHQLGAIIGKLHIASKDISIASNIEPKRWDKVFYFRDEAIVYKNKEFSDKLGKNNIRLLDNAIAFIDHHMKKMIKEKPLILIHGDINPWNILITNDELAIIDFEEALLGYPLQDIAVVLYYYRYHDEYLKFQKALINGYNSIGTQNDYSDFNLDVLMIARRLNFINYSLYIQDNPWDYINSSLQRVKEFSDKWINPKCEGFNQIK